MLGFCSAELEDQRAHQQPTTKANAQQPSSSSVYTSPTLSLLSTDCSDSFVASIARHLRLEPTEEPLRCTFFSSGEWDVCVPVAAVRQRKVWLVADGSLSGAEMKEGDWVMRLLIAAYACKMNAALRVSLLLLVFPNESESESLLWIMNLKLLARLLHTSGIGQLVVVEPSRPQLLGCFPMPVAAVPINDLLGKAVGREIYSSEPYQMLILCQDMECIKGAAEMRRVLGPDSEGRKPDLAVCDDLRGRFISSIDSDSGNELLGDHDALPFILVFYTAHITAATSPTLSAALRVVTASNSTRPLSVFIVSPHFQAAALQDLLSMHRSVLKRVFVGGQGATIHALERLPREVVDGLLVRVDVSERLAQCIIGLENM